TSAPTVMFTGLNLTANLGFLGLTLAGDANISATLSMGLQNPTDHSSTKITLSELFDNLGDITSIVKLPSLTGGGTASLRVFVSPSIPGLTISNAPIVLH